MLRAIFWIAGGSAPFWMPVEWMDADADWGATAFMLVTMLYMERDFLTRGQAKE